MQSKNNLSYHSFVKRRARQFFPFLMTDTVKNWTLNVEAIFARQKFILQGGFDYFRLRWAKFERNRIFAPKRT